MILFAILLASAQILSFSESLTGSAWNSYLGCVLTVEFRMSSRFVFNSLSISILIVWLAFSYFNRFTYLYTKPENRSPTRSWMYTTFARKRGLEIKKALESDEAATLADIESLDEACSLPKECLLMFGWAMRSFSNSFFWEIMWLCFGTTYGISASVYIRQADGIGPDQYGLVSWNFGQLVPLCLLAIPILSGLETYFGTYVAYPESLN